MLIQQKAGHINDFITGSRLVDRLDLEWHETNKRIQRKLTRAGREISLKFLNENPMLTQGDVLYADDLLIIAVDIIPCAVIVIRPSSLFEMASVCYEIGNKHLPLFYEDNAVLVPYEAPLFRLLAAMGFDVREEERKLMHPLRTTVSPHAHAGNDTLFSKIMKLTTSSANAK